MLRSSAILKYMPMQILRMISKRWIARTGSVRPATFTFIGCLELDPLRNSYTLVRYTSSNKWRSAIKQAYKLGALDPPFTPSLSPIYLSPPRFFEGIQGDTTKQGELFGIKNIFKLHEHTLSTKTVVWPALFATLYKDSLLTGL